MDLQNYLKNISKFNLLTFEEEQEVFKKVRLGDEEARCEAVLRNLRLVVNIARKYLHTKVSLEDLIQEGNSGLIKAVDKFDPSKNKRFSTYATFWIKQAVLRFLNETKNSVRYPSYIIDYISKITKYVDGHKARKGKRPSIDEIAKHFSFKKEDVSKILDLTNTIYISIEENFESEDIFHNFKNFDDLLCEELEQETIVDMVLKLRGKEREIIENRFGLFGKEQQTLETIAQKLSLTRERVRQIQNSVIAKLKQRLLHF